MWKQLVIAGKVYFLQTQIDSNQKTFKCSLLDLEQCWSESLPTTAVVQRARELNTRIEYDEKTILKTVLNAETPEAELLPATTSAAEEQQQEQEKPQHIELKLKYKINAYNFHYKWLLVLQNAGNFSQLVTLPILRALQGLTEQVKELQTCVIKKDAEIAGYKAEGALLKRTTLTTQIFNVSDFEKQHDEANKIAIEFAQAAQFVVSEQCKTRPSTPTNECRADAQPAVITPKQTNAVNSKRWTNLKTRLSPRSKKRKVLELQHKQMVQRLTASKGQVQYESSQSQSYDEMETMEPQAERKNILAELRDAVRQLNELSQSSPIS